MLYLETDEQQVNKQYNKLEETCSLRKAQGKIRGSGVYSRILN